MQSLTNKQHAFLEVYPSLFDRVYRYVATRTSNKAHVDDLVSDVMLKAFERLRQFDPEKGSHEQWVMGMAKFALIDHWRKRRDEIHLDEAVIANDKDEVVCAIDDKLSFEHRIAALPEDHKVMLRLRYVDDMSLDAIAEMLKKNPSTIRSFFSRTHKRLRLSFDETNV